MYYAWDIERFRAAVRNGTRHLFEGVPFAAARVGATDGHAGDEVLEPAETRAMAAPAAVFGQPENPACLAGVAEYPLVCPAKLLHRVNDAYVIGPSTLLAPDGRLFCPDLVNTPEKLERVLQANAGNRQYFVLERETQSTAQAFFFWTGLPRRLEATALFLANPEPGNYGSFIFRVLPQLVMAARNRLAFDVVIAADRSHWLLDAMRLLNLAPRPVLLAEEAFGLTIRQTLLFNDFCVEGFFPSSTAADFRALASRLATESAGRLYLSRTLSLMRTPRYRPLRNEWTLEARARERGFAVVYPETLPLVDQLRIFGGARKIAGPSGSGMLNGVFAAEGGRVLDMESFTVAVRQHAKAYASSGKQYAFAFGQFDELDDRESSVRNWRLPPDLFEAGLDWLLRD